ncbi:uncharacterized protein LOC115746022 [Rhodamnia argentea]|uniref:Uncharacterized protein LOC115746022 n=1 Tax=Rhodamnia argentea TaxID=178133 RepID=A0ABM3HKI4_9MYRT|nr:uncharacterized protein LOC115746022 [Rhodamnia argentea]
MYSPALLDLEITVISAKHLKNVNWRSGDLKPYATFSLDHDPYLRLSTRPDDSGSTRPVWNEILTIPLTAASPADAILTVEVFHSKPSETPKPLVGSSRFPLSHLIDSEGDAPRVYALDLYRPSGRPQGKLRIKLAVRERPRPPPPRYHDFAPEDRAPSVPTAPIDFSSYAVDHKLKVPSGYSSPYCPSAPVDFSYPVQEHRPIPPPRYTASAPGESLSSEHLIPTPRWIFDHRASAPVYPAPSNSRSSDNLVPNEPAAPCDSSRREQRPLPRCEDVGSVLGRLNLEEGNARETDYAARNAPGYGH